MEIEEVDGNGEIDFLISFCCFDICCIKFSDINEELLSLNFSKIIFKWAKDYFAKYGKCIKGKIKSNYISEKKFIKELDQEYIEDFIVKLFNEKDNISNQEFYVNKSSEFLKRRKLEVLSCKLEGFLNSGKLDNAFNEIVSFDSIRKVSNVEDVNPFDNLVINSFFDKLDEKVLFRYKGATGKLLGDFKRGWLAAFLAPMKRGKSWFLLETAIQAMVNKLKVVFISLEMDEDSVLERIYKRVLSATDYEDVLYPCIDCLNNQDGSCKKHFRRNRVTLLDKTGKYPKFSKDMKYLSCTKCRGTDDFKPASWFKIIKRPIFNNALLRKKATAIKNIYSRNRFKIKCYPKFSATVEDIDAYLNFLFIKRNFAPDVVIIDYADILNNEDRSLSERGKIDDIWKKLGNIALKRSCLVFTASQSNRNSFDSKSLKEKDIAEDIRKIAHADLVVGINQTDKEKLMGVSRFNIVVHRHKKASKNMQSLILQQYEVGQVMIDSELIFS